MFVADVAEVVDGPDQPARYVWTGTRASGEQPAVTLQITKKPGENAVEVARRVARARATSCAAR